MTYYAYSVFVIITAFLTFFIVRRVIRDKVKTELDLFATLLSSVLLSAAWVVAFAAFPF